MKRTLDEILGMPDDAMLMPEDLTVWFGLRKSWILQHSGDGAARPVIPSVKLGKYRRYRKGTIAEWLSKTIPGVTA